MPRSPRIEYAQARYHVMSRGNRRERILAGAENKRLFLATLEQACSRSGWIVHAYVLMDNHFHLLLETPEPNLSEGMRWLQGTYATRYNLRHGLVGHVWQGRFKSPLISDESDDHFHRVSRYIHLNPVRAGWLDGEKSQLMDYEWSSFPELCSAPSRRPPWLKAETTFQVYGLSGDDAQSRKNYCKRMELTRRECLQGVLDEEIERDRQSLIRGWYIGDRSFRDRVKKSLNQAVSGRKSDSLRGEAKRAHSEDRARSMVEQSLRHFDMTAQQFLDLPKNDMRKSLLVSLLHQQTSVPYTWIVEELNMGSSSSVYQAIRRVREGGDEFSRSLKELQKVTKCVH